jgi:hypothetical protein
MEQSGQTGADLVQSFRSLDARHNGVFAIIFHDAIDGGVAPPFIPGIILDSAMYLETGGTDQWYSNVGLVAHELTHQKQSASERLTNRGEVQAYQAQAQVRLDLRAQGKGRELEQIFVVALTVDIQSWTAIRQFYREELHNYNSWVYDYEPIWGVRRDVFENFIAPTMRYVDKRIRVPLWVPISPEFPWE